MLSKIMTFEETHNFLKALKTGRHFDWPIVGFMLLSAEHHRIWQNDCNSFTAWVRMFAKEIDKQESSCWRYLAAARFYLKLKEFLNDNKIDSPAITALSGTISPESFELLDKLHRVMPNDQFLSYAQRTLENTIKRNELREAWSIYRPSLRGKTARGIKVAPKLNTKDKHEFNSQSEAIAIMSLINSDGFWAKKSKSDLYKTYREVRLQISISDNNFILETDLIVLTGSKDTCEINFHLVEFLGHKNCHDLADKLIAANKYVNYVWIMSNLDLMEFTKDLPINFGLISMAGPDSFYVKREAIYAEVDQTPLLKQILISSI